MLGKLLWDFLMKPALMGVGPVTAALIGGAIGGGAGFLSGKKGKRDPYGSLNPEQVQLNKALGPYFQGQLGEPELYSGQQTEPITAGEQAAVGSSNRLAGMSESGYAELMNPDLNAYNKQFDEWMANPQMNLFRRNVLPGIQEAMPTFSTAMGAATQRGYQDVADNLAQQRYAGWQAAQDRRLQALGQAPGAMNQYAKTAAIPREIQQAGLDRLYNDWARGQTQKQNSVNQMLQFLGISTVTQTPDTRWERAIQGANLGANIGMGIAGMNQQDSQTQAMLDAYNRRTDSGNYWQNADWENKITRNS